MYAAHKPTIGTYAKDRKCVRCGVALPDCDAIMTKCMGEEDGGTMGGIGGMGGSFGGDLRDNGFVRVDDERLKEWISKGVDKRIVDFYEQPGSHTHDEWRAMNEPPIGYMDAVDYTDVVEDVITASPVPDITNHLSEVGKTINYVTRDGANHKMKIIGRIKLNDLRPEDELRPDIECSTPIITKLINM